VSADIAKRSITCFGTIIIRLPHLSQTVAAQLKNFLGLQISYVTTETIKVLKDILRKYPNFVQDFVPLICRIQSDQITENDGKVAFVWILGEFGEMIEDSPYILERMSDEVRELNNSSLSSALFNSIFKLFFKRAPETVALFKKVFQEIMQNGNDAQLK
jgi:AP-4 complex subunit beta-1